MATRSAASPLLIDVFQAARQGDAIEGALSLSAMQRLRPSLTSDEGEVRYRYVGCKDALGRPAGALTVSATVQLVCDRCSRPVDVQLTNEANYYFVATESELGRIPVDEADEEPLLGSMRFDLASLIEDDAILALPMSPRHDVCGPGLVTAPRETDDGEGAETRRHPFADLAKLKPRQT